MPRATGQQAVHTYNGTEQYGYDPSGQRVWKQTSSRSMVYFYGVDGTLLGTYGDGADSDYNVYFAGKQIWAERTPSGSMQPGPVALDRLGSVVSGTRYFPYGDEPSTTTQDRVKFATYYRDSTSTLDYARNRYYSRSIARFTTPDPFGGSATFANPQSWNRYTYAGDDPVNANDPAGLNIQLYLAPVDWWPWDWSEQRSSGGGRGWPTYPCDDGWGAGLLSRPICWVPLVLILLPPEPPKPLEFPCFAQLKYRDVDDPIAELAGATHAFWWVQTRTGAHYIISGGYQEYEEQGTKVRYLKAWAEPGDSNGKDDSGDAVAWNSGLSRALCDAIDQMIAAAKSYPSHTTPYNAPRGPNSNSMARYVGEAGGLSPTPPPLAHTAGAWGSSGRDDFPRQPASAGSRRLGACHEALADRASGVGGQRLVTSALRRTIRTKAAVAVAGLTLVALGTVLMLVAVGFGIERSEMRVEAPSRSFHDQLGRAEWLAVAGFFATQLAASAFLTASLRSRLRIHWALRFLALLVATTVCSFLGALLLLNYGTYCLPVWSLHDALRSLILKMTP